MLNIDPVPGPRKYRAIRTMTTTKTKISAYSVKLCALNLENFIRFSFLVAEMNITLVNDENIYTMKSGLQAINVR